jgi:hypothetical protein
MSTQREEKRFLLIKYMNKASERMCSSNENEGGREGSMRAFKKKKKGKQE